MKLTDDAIRKALWNKGYVARKEWDKRLALHVNRGGTLESVTWWGGEWIPSMSRYCIDYADVCADDWEVLMWRR